MHVCICKPYHDLYLEVYSTEFGVVDYVLVTRFARKNVSRVLAPSCRYVYSCPQKVPHPPGCPNALTHPTKRTTTDLGLGEHGSHYDVNKPGPADEAREPLGRLRQLTPQTYLLV